SAVTGILLAPRPPAITAPNADRFKCAVDQALVSKDRSAPPPGDMVGRIKNYSANIAERSKQFTVICRPQRIAAVLDYIQFVTLSNIHNCFEIERIAKSMSDNYSARALADRLFD